MAIITVRKNFVLLPTPAWRRQARTMNVEMRTIAIVVTELTAATAV